MTRYRDLADDLRRRILQGGFRPGERLPAEQRLANEYGVSRGVVRNALAALRRRGLVESRPGAGWRVSAERQTQEFARLRSFAPWAESRGMTPGGRVVQQRRLPAGADDARRLDIRVGEDLLHVTRVRTLDGRPVMLERTRYAPWAIPIIEPLPADAPSVTAALLAAGVTMAYGSHRIDTVAATTEDADLLAVRRSTRLLRMRRVTHAADGRPIESGDDRYAPDTVAFEIHTSASGPFVDRVHG